MLLPRRGNLRRKPSPRVACLVGSAGRPLRPLPLPPPPLEPERACSGNPPPRPRLEPDYSASPLRLIPRRPPPLPRKNQRRPPCSAVHRGTSPLPVARTHSLTLPQRETQHESLRRPSSVSPPPHPCTCTHPSPTRAAHPLRVYLESPQSRPQSRVRPKRLLRRFRLAPRRARRLTHRRRRR